MKKGWKKGFDLGKKVSKYLAPPAAAVVLGWYAYEATDQYMTQVEWHDFAENAAPYGAAVVGGLTGGAVGWAAKITYIPQLTVGVLCGSVCALAEGSYNGLKRVFGRKKKTEENTATKTLVDKTQAPDNSDLEKKL